MIKGENAMEYNGRYFISGDIIKDILQKEYDRHTQEIKAHGEQFDMTGSLRQKKKLVKHLNKRFQTGHIAELLNIKLGKPINQLDFLKKICDVHNSDYRAIKERIMELEKKQ